jgi:TDG/mug DNA glycosylase family protein
MSILPDLLTHNLKIVFCGTAAGNESAQQKAYYAKSTNSFWETLHHIGLTPTQLSPHQYEELLNYGLGLTDISKIGWGMDKELSNNQFDIDGFEKKIEQFQPIYVCFNGKKAGQIYFNDKKISYGLQNQTLGKTKFFVVPSTSGAARGYWDISYWKELANYVIK